LPQDTLVTATNPAGMAFFGHALDIGVSFFNPSDRGYKANSNYATQSVPATDGVNNFSVDFPTGGFVTPGKYDSDSDWFVIPSIGYNYQINDRSTIGISIYGNGGMNTKYDKACGRTSRRRRTSRPSTGSPLFATMPRACRWTWAGAC
jgi:long-chain fatty acid transport protein